MATKSAKKAPKRMDPWGWYAVRRPDGRVQMHLHGTHGGTTWNTTAVATIRQPNLVTTKSGSVYELGQLDETCTRYLEACGVFTGSTPATLLAWATRNARREHANGGKS